MTNVGLANLYALRAHLDSVILAAEVEAGISHEDAKDPGVCQTCGASSDLVEDSSTLDGTKRRRCTQCGTEWEL